MSSDRQSLKLIARIAENLPEISPSVMQGWIQNPRALKKALGEALCPPESRVFKIIKLGTGLRTADDFRNAFKQGGCGINYGINGILGSFAFIAATEETEIDLVVVSVADLGFGNGARRSVIYARAQELGLELCPPEVGPQLRLQYKDQPRGEQLFIGMEPIVGSDGGLHVFYIGHGHGGLWLSDCSGDPYSFWSASSRWAFLRRK